MRKRSGLLIMLVGVVVAFLASLMVLAMARQASAQQRAEVPQVLVVMASRDVPEGIVLAADALTVQAFPADFVPQGAIPAPEQAVGKYTVTRLTKGQILLANQLSPTKRAGNLALSVPPGKVAVALPMTDLMSNAKAINPGDRVDILLTIDLVVVNTGGAGAPPAGAPPAGAPPAGGGGGKNPITQATLQNVEILSVGEAEESSPSTNEVTTSGRRTPAIIVLLDHQDAIVLKYAKDSGGVIDLALRAPDDTAQVRTDPMTIDLLFERFNFRRPASIP